VGVRFDVMSVDVRSSPSAPRGLVWECVGGVVAPVKPITGFAER